LIIKFHSFYLICFQQDYPGIMNKSQNWHTNPDGLELSFFLPFYFFNFFNQFIYYHCIFLFKLVKLVRLIKPIRVNEPSLICFFFVFLGTLMSP